MTSVLCCFAERDEVPGSPVSASSATSGWEKQNGSHGTDVALGMKPSLCTVAPLHCLLLPFAGPPTSPSSSSMASRKSTESVAGSRWGCPAGVLRWGDAAPRWEELGSVTS